MLIVAWFEGNGLLVVLVYMQLVLKLGPCEDNTDDWLSFMTSFQLLITLLGGLLLFTDDPDPANQTYDSEIMGMVLIGVNLIAFVALFVSLVLLCPCIRRRCEKKETATTLTKVVPTEVAPSTERHRYADGTLKTDKNYYADQKTILSVHVGQSRPKEVQNWADWSEDSGATNNGVVENTKEPRALDLGGGLLKKSTRKTGLKRNKTTRQELRDIRSEYGTESKEYQTAIKNMR